jgi:hypothetical protein
MDTTVVILLNPGSSAITLWQIILPALTALIVGFGGATIGAWTSHKTATLQFKANVEAAGKKEWIRDFRDCVSEYLMLTTTFVGYEASKKAFHYTDKEILAKVGKMLLSMSKLQLLLNPADSQQQRIIDIMDNIFLEAQKEPRKKDHELIRNGRAELTTIARLIVRKEWESMTEVK